MKNHKSLPAVFLLGTLSCTSNALFAQQASEPELPTVVTTADRVARTVDETLAPVTVITRKDIERLQAKSLPDALRGLPGVMLGNNGGPGKNTSLFLRGTNSDHVLILIDGVKVGSATSGTAALQDIPIDQIERIELVRGPRASLYGSEAIGGVLQIFTKKGAQPLSASLGAGSRSTLEGAANVGFGSSQSVWGSAGVSGYRTRGINSCQGNTSAGCFTNEPDRDPYKTYSYNLRGGARLADSLNAELQYLQFDSSNHFDGSSQNEADSRQQVGSGILNFTPFDAWRSRLKVGESTDESLNYKSTHYENKLFSSRFLTRRDTASWLNELTLSKGHEVVVGLDYLRDKVIGTTNYTVRSRRNQALFAEYMADLGAVDSQVALRHDKNEQFGHHNTGSAALGYTVSKSLRFTASYGTAFKAPSFNQLYFPGFGTVDLKPERSRNTELGVNGALGEQGKWQVSLFDNRISNLIAGSPLANVSFARIHGVELTASQRWGNTSLAGSATFQNPKDHSGGASEGNLLVRRPRQTARLDFDQDIGDFSVGTTWLGVGTRYDNTANNIKLGGYSTWDLRGEYRFDKSWRAQLRFENLFDRRYETAYLYNQPGLGAFLTLRYQMK